MAGQSFGATGIAKVAFGTTEIKKISYGDTLIWQAVTLTAAGMTKNGVQTLGDTNRQRITGWTVRSGFPLTVIDDNRIRIIGSGQVDVVAQINFAQSGSSTDQGRWLVHNGVDVRSAPTRNQIEATISERITVADGDLLWVDAQSSSTTFSYDDIAATSYITVTPVQ